MSSDYDDVTIPLRAEFSRVKSELSTLKRLAMRQVAGIVLCGGKSQRMGRAKAWLPFGDELLLQRTVRILSEVVSPIVVVGAQDQALPALPQAVCSVCDQAPDQGPLQGFATGLQQLPASVNQVFLCACDQPFLAPEWIRLFLDEIGEQPACVAKLGGYLHPLAAAYRSDLLPAIQRMLLPGKTPGLRHLLATISPRVLDESALASFAPAFSPVQNLNTPEDYHLALDRAFGVSSRAQSALTPKNAP